MSDLLINKDELLTPKVNCVESKRYKMINELEIKIFKGIQELKISKTALVNIIVGENGTGKTAFLESLFLATGVSSEIAFRLKSWRSGSLEGMASPSKMTNKIFSGLFGGYGDDKQLSVEFRDSNGSKRKLEIKRSESLTSLISPNEGRSAIEVPYELTWFKDGQVYFKDVPKGVSAIV